MFGHGGGLDGSIILSTHHHADGSIISPSFSHLSHLTTTQDGNSETVYRHIARCLNEKRISSGSPDVPPFRCVFVVPELIPPATAFVNGIYVLLDDRYLTELEVEVGLVKTL